MTTDIISTIDACLILVKSRIQTSNEEVPWKILEHANRHLIASLSFDKVGSETTIDILLLRLVVERGI